MKKIAIELLKPYGIFQKGQSRTFLKDNVCYTIIIEFQPSSFSKGTYLNIGVDFNFYPRDYFAFSYGYTEKSFEEFKDEKHFNILVNELCDLTINRVRKLDQKFVDIWRALKTLDKENENNTWRIYEVAVLNILTSNFERSRILLLEVSKTKCIYDWEIERKKVVDELIDWLKERPTDLDKIENLINKTRQLKNLPMVTLNKFTERKTTPTSTLPKAVSSWLRKLFD